MTKKIILIEDDENLRRGISFYLDFVEESPFT